MKNILLLSLVCVFASCITVNYGGATPANRTPVLSRSASDSPSGGSGGDRIVYRATMNMATFKPERLQQTIITDTLLLKGEVIHNSLDRIVVRVPMEHLSNMMADIKKLGKVISLNVYGDNLTLPVEDNTARLDSLIEARRQYSEILNKATAVQDILAANREIDQINSQIQYLQSQQRDQDMRSKYSELTVNIQKRKMYGPLGWVFYGIWYAVRWLFWWG